MSGVPDFPLAETIDFKFTTRAFSTGVPTTLAGTPVIEVYEDNSVTQITAGETLTVDFDGVTGLNNLRIVATGANGYETGKSYAVVLSAGTVDSVSVVGEVVAQFTIERSPALRPTTIGRTLDVTATGAAGIDWANVENPTTSLDLSGTDIQLCDTVTTLTGHTAQTGDSYSRLGAPAGASIAADLVVIDNFVDGIETAVITNAAGVDIAADIIAVKSETAAIVADTNELQADWVNGGRLDLLLDAIPTTAMRGTDSAALASVLGAAVGVDISADIAAVKSDSAAIKTKTDSLTFTKANEVDANAQSINGATVTGDGNATPWDGA